MPRRKAWNGNPPSSPQDARRKLVEVARQCVERVGIQKAGLSDVAEAAGVTRQTVYRYFDSTEALFNSAAALASGGFHQRMRTQAERCATVPERILECLVFAVIHLPSDPHLSALADGENHLALGDALRLGFVQEEILHLAGADGSLPTRELNELAEVLARMLRSFLADEGERRTEDELRQFLHRWVLPGIQAHLG